MNAWLRLRGLITGGAGTRNTEGAAEKGADGPFDTRDSLRPSGDAPQGHPTGGHCARLGYAGTPFNLDKLPRWASLGDVKFKGAV